MTDSTPETLLKPNVTQIIAENAHSQLIAELFWGIWVGKSYKSFGVLLLL